MVLGELGAYPLHINIKTRMVSFWNRLNNQNKLSYSLYSLVCSLGNTSPWVNYIQSILNNCGLSYVWTSQCLGINANWLKRAIELCYQDQFQQHWHSIIDNSNKCSIYRMFKSKFQFESYLNNVPFKLRKYLTKFRCRSTHIPVEAGIFIGVERDHRLCTLCPLHVLGDEFHYIFQCTYFSVERNLYISQQYSNNPSAFKMDVLFNVNGLDLVNLCKFIKCILSKFS